MKFFVAGGAGYIGAQFVREAIKHGNSCFVFDDLSRGHETSIPEGVEWQKGSILDKKVLKHSLETYKPEVVVHFAAFALVGESVASPDIYYRNNFGGTLSLLDVMRSLDKKPDLVFSSTCAVYGSPRSLPMDETGEKAPESPYGWSKLMCEQIIEDSCKAYNLKAIALRYFNACGADLDGLHGEDHDPETHLIPNIINSILEKETLTVHGNDFDTEDGTCVRDYIHIVDLADAHLKAGEYLQSQNPGHFEVFNLGSGKGHTVLQVIEATEQVVGKSVEKIMGKRRPGDAAALYADPTHVADKFGFQTKYSDLKTILESAYRWHSK